jgi:hypothetical protein
MANQFGVFVHSRSTRQRVRGRSMREHVRKINEASFAGLVVLAGEFHPIPFRTRPLKPPAPMVLRLKPRESRSLPVQPRTLRLIFRERARALHDNPASQNTKSLAREISRGFLFAAVRGSCPNDERVLLRRVSLLANAPVRVAWMKELSLLMTRCSGITATNWSNRLGGILRRDLSRS